MKNEFQNQIVIAGELFYCPSELHPPKDSSESICISGYELESHQFFMVNRGKDCTSSKTDNYNAALFVKYKSSNAMPVKDGINFFSKLSESGTDRVRKLVQDFPPVRSTNSIPFLFKIASISTLENVYEDTFFGNDIGSKIEYSDIAYEKAASFQEIVNAMKKIHGKTSKFGKNENGFAHYDGQSKGQRKYRYISSVLENKINWTGFSNTSNIDILDSDIQTDWINRLLYLNRVGVRIIN